MRSCLKCSTPPSPTPPPAITPPVAGGSDDGNSSASSGTRPALCHKHVSFRPAIEEAVYVADEWDRTPMDPCRRLSYSDVLELKQMHATLPRAEQAPETAAYMPRFLKQVPIHLLPLLPAQDGPKMTSARDMFKSSPKSSPPMSPVPSPTTSSAPLLPSPSARNAHAHTYHHAPSPLTKGYTPPTPPPRATGYGYGAVPRMTSARDMFAKPGSHPPSPPATPPLVQKPLASTTTPGLPKRRLNMSFVPLISSSEPTSPPAQEHPTISSGILNPDADHAPLPPIASAPSVSNSSDASSGAEIKRSPSSANSDPPHDDQPHSDLATPSSTPALTTRSLDDTDTETSMPPTPAEPELALPGSSMASAGAPDAQQTSPSRRRMDLNEHLDQFPAPPTRIPDGPSSSSSTTTSSLAPSSPPSAEALSKRLAHLANGGGSSPSGSNGTNGTSNTTTPSAASDYTSGSVSSSGASSVHEGPWGMSYFGLPLRGKVASHPTAAVAIPSHLRKGSGAALPDSPFIDPMMMAGGPRAPPAQGSLHTTAPSGDATDRLSMHIALTLPNRALKGLRLEALPSPSLMPPSPFILGGDQVLHSRTPTDPVLVPLPPPVRADGLL